MPASPLNRKTSPNGNALPFFFFAPVHAVLSHLVFIGQERINALIQARNEIQLEVAMRMFPNRADCQMACLYSTVCRLRVHHLLLAKPWYLSWYVMGFRESIIELVIHQICHHQKCGVHQLLMRDDSR